MIIQEKIRSIFIEIMKEDKRTGYFKQKNMSKMKQVCIFVFSMAMIMIFYFSASTRIEKMKEKELFANCNSIYTNNTDYELSYRIESMEPTDGKVELSGWAFDLNSKNKDIQVALRDVETSKVILCKTEVCAREDIERDYGSISSCGEVGFLSWIADRKLNKENCYEVMLSLEYEDLTVQRFSTGNYIYNKELYKYNPLKFEVPVVDKEEFAKAIREGEICAYDFEKRMWIYKYDDKLYFIIDYSLIGNFEQKPKFPVYLYTSQKEKLPENVRAEEIGRADYVLKAHECMNENKNEFYLLAVPIDVEYPVTCIRTGLYQGGEWDWMVTFRP